MAKRAGPSLGLTLLAVLVLGQDLISMARGNNGHADTSTVLLGAGKEHTLPPKHSG